MPRKTFSAHSAAATYDPITGAPRPSSAGATGGRGAPRPTVEQELSTLWDEHCRYEFDPASKSTPHTMDTMVGRPSVIHVPTLVGGTGKRLLSHFYENHFIHANPPMELAPLRRTVQETQPGVAGSLVDEMIICCKHDREIDWMLPGLPPTGLPIRIPLVASIDFAKEDGEWRLVNERIYWDQASVLAQVGALPANLVSSLPVIGGEQADNIDPAKPQPLLNELLGRLTERPYQPPTESD